MFILLAGQAFRKFEEHYSEVLRNQASVTLKITKCTTIGPPCKGKTCLKHLLTGQQWDMEVGMASTDIMEAPEWVECYGVEEGGADTLWKLASKEQQHGELLQAINATIMPVGDREAVELCPLSAELQEEEWLPPGSANSTAPSDTPPPTEQSAAPPPTEPNVAPPPNEWSYTPPPTDLSVIPLPRGPNEVQLPTLPCPLKQGVQVLANVFSSEHVQGSLKDKQGKVLGERRLIHFINTGGQAIYNDINPVLIGSPNVFLVVFSLKELYYMKSHKERLDYFRSDLIQRPLRSIYTFGMKNPQDKGHLDLHPEAPKILIVGTHLDQIPLGDSDKEGYLDDVSQMIEQEIGNKPYCKFVQFDIKDRSFWAVDNTQAGKEQDKCSKEYSTALRMMVQEGPTEMSVRVPLPWLLLYLVMGKEKHYCKYSKLLEEACVRGYVREHSASADLDTMLRLFHILGLFFHKVPSGYKKEDSLVFINPDYLYSATFDFLMAAKEVMEDSLGGSELGQHQTQAATMEDTEDSQGGKEDQHQTEGATMKTRSHGEELVEVRIPQRDLEQGGVVEKNRVIERMKDNAKSFQHEMKAVLQYVEDTVAKIGQEPELVLKSLHTQLKEMGQEWKPPEGQDAAYLKDKWQLFIGRLIRSLASSVNAALDDSEGKGETHSKEVAEAVERVRVQYQSRSNDSLDVDQLLPILLDLRVVAQLSDPNSYVVPAALPKVHHSERIDGNADPILITVVSQTIMRACYLPSGLFCCLISELVTGLGWTVIPLERTHVTFTHKSLIGQVHIIEHGSYIEVKLESQASLEDPKLSKTCQTVREKMHESIVRVSKILYSDPTAGTTFVKSMVWGFQCEEHPEDETHIAVFQEKDKYECWTKCLLEPWNVHDVEPKQLVWFP